MMGLSGVHGEEYFLVTSFKISLQEDMVQVED